MSLLLLPSAPQPWKMAGSPCPLPAVAGLGELKSKPTRVCLRETPSSSRNVRLPMPGPTHSAPEVGQRIPEASAPDRQASTLTLLPRLSVPPSSWLLFPPCPCFPWVPLSREQNAWFAFRAQPSRWALQGPKGQSHCLQGGGGGERGTDLSLSSCSGLLG